MKRYVIFGMFAIVLSFHSAAGARSIVDVGVPSLPEELEAFYPPKAEGPVYLLRMLTLEGAFSGIAAEIEENDMGGARELFKIFKTDYLAVKNMVEEWRDYFPETDVEALGRALEGNNKESMFSAFGRVGNVCHSCHQAAMAAVQQKYRWGNFSELTVPDADSGARLPYAVLKKSIGIAMAGVRVDVSQAQWDGARKHFSTLQGRFAAMTGTCTACHAEEPKYFVSPDALPLLAVELDRDRPDSGKVNTLLQMLGRQSCGGCHLIHVPAAMAAAGTGTEE